MKYRHCIFLNFYFFYSIAPESVFKCISSFRILGERARTL